MQQRGRKSAASLSVVAGSIDGRPKAPEGLTERQAEIWDRTVANEAADMFRTAALQQMLADYCRHRDSAESLTLLIDAETVAGPDARFTLAEMDRLMKMRERETRAAADKATKLRLTNQSRYTPKAAATAAGKVADRKLWDRVA